MKPKKKTKTERLTEEVLDMMGFYASDYATSHEEQAQMEKNNRRLLNSLIGEVRRRAINIDKNKMSAPTM